MGEVMYRSTNDEEGSDSDFYGDHNVQASLENKAKRRLESPYHFPTPAKKVKLSPTTTSITKSEHHAIESTTPQPASSINVLDFLKSRPQLAALHKDSVQARQPSKRDEGRTLSNGAKADDLVQAPDRFAGVAAARQRNESIDAFLSRAPVDDPATTSLGPWLWIDSPKIPYRQSKLPSADVDAFIDGGEELLTNFRNQRDNIGNDNPGKPPGTITRYLRPYREQLEDSVLTLAVETHITSGKWMLFPKASDVARTWRLIVTATAEGRLGPTSKVATYDELQPTADRVICVYTYDFSDDKDVRRVLDEIVDLGLCPDKGIFYKCDAYTYLRLGSGNPYKIRASVYSSQEVLGQKAKATDDGPIARLQSRRGPGGGLLSM